MDGDFGVFNGVNGFVEVEKKFEFNGLNVVVVFEFEKD